ncbi:MAG: hypothetical protein GY792_11455 [Gammaproteobacteria bacterium]|nr:hypothetical protein [Gammaproteobacteria bacterium]
MNELEKENFRGLLKRVFYNRCYRELKIRPEDLSSDEELTLLQHHWEMYLMDWIMLGMEKNKSNRKGLKVIQMREKYVRDNQLEWREEFLKQMKDFPCLSKKQQVMQARKRMAKYIKEQVVLAGFPDWKPSDRWLREYFKP